MPSGFRNRAPRLAALALALLVAVPATAMFVRTTVHFAASFDVSSAPGGGSVQADVGQIVLLAPPTEFNVTPTSGGGGELNIHDSGTLSQATLVGTFKTNFKGQQLDATWTMRSGQTTSQFDVRFVDDSDSGMIDCGFGGDGTIVVGGQHLMPYVAGVDYDFALTINSPMVGPVTWTVLVTALDGSQATAAGLGVLPYTSPVTIKAVMLVRPAGAPAGDFWVDELKAVSSSPSFK
jgi:hypothetical protein